MTNGRTCSFDIRASVVAVAWLSFSLSSLVGCGAANGGGTGGSMSGAGSGGLEATGGTSSGGAAIGSGGLTGGTSSGGTAGCDGPVDAKYPALTECGEASLDRFTKWWGTAEGPTNPGDGSSLLVADDECGGYVARVSFEHAPAWHVAPVWVKNEFSGVDVSAATEIRIEYSATSDFWVQLRPLSTYSGGSKWHHLLPSTNGARSLLTIPLTEEAWFEKFGPPPTTVEGALAELCGLVFVGNTNNTIEISSLRIEGYEPPCP